MSTIVPILKPSSKRKKRFKAHIRTEREGKDSPLCGGGNSARKVNQWQLEFGLMTDITCLSCLRVAVNKIKKEKLEKQAAAVA